MTIFIFEASVIRFSTGNCSTAKDWSTFSPKKVSKEKQNKQYFKTLFLVILKTQNNRVQRQLFWSFDRLWDR